MANSLVEAVPLSPLAERVSSGGEDLFRRTQRTARLKKMDTVPNTKVSPRCNDSSSDTTSSNIIIMFY
ncbi:hypothetical protein WISP_09566 [Willisornis vidua]|uniref:Uncharacterized protein n=1 Tax=Willisornis vidua TaxID=1566151 RepID=A0ABQ9DY20_9PASS|nr:hypothetical protein WISP_09566 [Willisornis vidua]